MAAPDIGERLSTLDRLQAADRRASSQPAASTAGSAVQPCPLTQRWALEVVVIGADDSPVPDVWIVLRSGGQAIATRTDLHGQARFTGLTAGAYEFSLAALDETAWQPVSQSSLGPAAQSGGPDAPWQVLQQVATEPREPGALTVVQGQTAASLAWEYGHLTKTLWSHGNNEDVRSRRPSPNVLQPGDKLFIPAIRRAWSSAETGNRYVVRMPGVPHLLKVRFLYWNGQPRKGVAYKFVIDARSGIPFTPRQGKLNGEGFLIEAIPADALAGEIVIDDDGERIRVPVRIAYLNPLDDVSGIQGRLGNLGYSCGDEDGTIGERSRTALRRFQRDHHISESGEIDEPTRAALKLAHLS